MRLASGIAPILEMLGMGVRVGLGVDGSASNDGSHLLEEVFQIGLNLLDGSFNVHRVQEKLVQRRAHHRLHFVPLRNQGQGDDRVGGFREGFHVDVPVGEGFAAEVSSCSEPRRWRTLSRSDHRLGGSPVISDLEGWGGRWRWRSLPKNRSALDIYTGAMSQFVRAHRAGCDIQAGHDDRHFALGEQRIGCSVLA
jgi:hypothetical protein